MISYFTRKTGGDTIMLALHTQVTYFSASVPTPILVKEMLPTTCPLFQIAPL
jgi:hypothetical protein